MRYVLVLGDGEVLEFYGSPTELEGIAMDFKKFIADLAARYRKLTEPNP